MPDPVEALIVDLIEWVSFRDRTYEEVLDAWRTSCPRLPVWEEANDRGLLAEKVENGRRMVRLTTAGTELMNASKTRS
jgi:D-3-phosphoglycerate dehydrogenase / 2-oxoglutarate reductase